MSGMIDYSTGRPNLIVGGAVFDPITMTIASIATTAIGTAVSAAGAMAAGQNAQAMGNFQQQEYAQQGENDIATSQRKMLEQQRRTQLVQSTLIARGAGNGENTSVGSDVKLSSDIAGRGTYNSLMDLSQGQNAAAGLTNMGSAAKYQGDLTDAMAPYAAIGDVASGASSMFSTASKMKWG